MSASSTFRSPRLTSRRCALWQVLFVAVTCLAAARASAGEAAGSEYRREQWGSDRGFPGGPVYAIAQTPDGYLWIGAEKGLVRFDGVAFRLLHPAAAAPRAGATVLGIVSAPDGAVWARLRGAALVRHQRGAFENIVSHMGAPEAVVTAMIAGRDNSILLATLGSGVVQYRGGHFTPVAAPSALPAPSVVISMAWIGDDIWLGTRDAGLLRVNAGRITRLTEGLPDLKINALLEGRNGDLWIGTDKGLARWRNGAITRGGISPGLSGVPALAMIRDGKGHVWIAAGARGLLRVTDGDVAQMVAAHAPSRAPHVSAVFEDRDGNLWTGTERGIERWRQPVFTTYSADDGLPSDTVGSLHADKTGRLWFAPTDGGLGWIRDGRVSRIRQAGLDREVVYSIEGAGDDVWVGTQRTGLARIQVSGGRLTVSRYTQADGLAQDNVYAVYRARDGAIWAGTLSGGVSRFSKGTFTSYGTKDGLASNTVAAILESADGTLWFATPDGLSALSRGGWRRYAMADGLPSNDVNTLFEDRTGHLWIGTAAGLAVMHAGQVVPLPGRSLMPAGSVLGIEEDHAGSFWIATDTRVVRVNREALLRGTLRDGEVRDYGLADGLLALEGVKRHRTVAADASGRIWFALTRGLSVADPVRAREGSPPALTHVEEMLADGASIDLNRPIAFPSSRRRIAFGFTGLSLSSPERVRFRYRLDGFDREWSAPVADRQTAYTNLNPGSYVFRVISSNGEGQWNGPEATLPFDIRPTFWQSGSFQVAVVLVCVAAWFGLHRLRLRQVARQLNVRFEERLSERTRIAQDLHDTLLQGFVSASMQLHVAAEGLPADSSAKSSVGRVLDLMGRVIEEGRNAVRGLRSTTSAADDLERAFSRIQHELALPYHAAYRVIVEGRPRPLRPIIRDEVYRIGREGTVNAFRHAAASHIEVEIQYTVQELRLFVRDDGRGVEPAVVRSGSDGHWGIVGMRERTERIGGTLRIRSRASAGTEIEVRVPAGVAFERGGPRPRSPRWASRLRRQIVGPRGHEQRPEKQP